MEKPTLPDGKFLSLFKNGFPIDWEKLPLKAQNYISDGVNNQYSSGRIRDPDGNIYIYQIMDNN